MLFRTVVLKRTGSWPADTRSAIPTIALKPQINLTNVDDSCDLQPGHCLSWPTKPILGPLFEECAESEIHETLPICLAALRRQQSFHQSRSKILAPPPADVQVTEWALGLANEDAPHLFCSLFDNELHKACPGKDAEHPLHIYTRASANGRPETPGSFRVLRHFRFCWSWLA